MMQQMFGGGQEGTQQQQGGPTGNEHNTGDPNGVKTAIVHEYHVKNIGRVKEVISATYGSGYQNADVTEKVRSLIQENAKTGGRFIKLVGVRSLNQHFGDPVVGQVKKLTVKYRFLQKNEMKPAEVETETEIYSITVDAKPMGFRYDGTKVTHVFPWGHAAKAGMTPGSTIMMVNGQDADEDSVTALYQTAQLPFQVVLSRETPKKKLSKEEKLQKQHTKLTKKIEKTQQKMVKADKKVEVQAKKLAKQSANLQKEAQQLQKKKAKLEAGKGNPKKLVKQMAKQSIKLVNKTQNLQKREQKHGAFVSRLERQKEKMQAKLAKMEQKLSKIQSQKEPISPEGWSSDSSDEMAPPAPEQPQVDQTKADEPKPAELVFKVAVDHPYYEQNQALVSMGFADERNNMHVLAQSDGNLPRAIEMLVESANNL